MKMSSAIVGCLMCAVAVTVTNASTVLFEDTFDSENGGVQALNYTGFANWNVTRTSVDLIAPGGADDIYPGNGMYVDMNGSIPGVSRGKIETKTLFILDPGLYELSFNLGNNNRGVNTPPNTTNSVTVSLGSVYSETFSRIGTIPLENITRQISVGSSTSGRIFFDSGLPADVEGIIIDHVKLTLIPEPSAALLVGISALSTVFILKRR